MFAEVLWASRMKSWEDRGQPGARTGLGKKAQFVDDPRTCPQHSCLKHSPAAARVCPKEAFVVGVF